MKIKTVKIALMDFVKFDQLFDLNLVNFVRVGGVENLAGTFLMIESSNLQLLNS